MNTKERILVESLTLFSEKGYDSVYLSDIAANVGIKTPSLYKHFKSKEEIFNSCVAYFYENMNSYREKLLLPGTMNSSLNYAELSIDEIQMIARQMFNYYLTDQIAAKFRRLLLMGRYQNDELNRIYEQIFINEVIEYETQVFETLIDKGLFKDIGAQQLALKFYSPIYFLLSKYDTKIENLDKGYIELEEAIVDFCQSYQVNKNEKN